LRLLNTLKQRVHAHEQHPVMRSRPELAQVGKIEVLRGKIRQ